MFKNAIKFQAIKSEENDKDEDIALYKINTYGVDFSLEVYSHKIDEGDIIVPSFQRRYVWSHKKASKLIESFLLGLPVPQIFLSREQDTEKLLVVDGQQRLKTINQFFHTKFENGRTFYLTGVKTRWEGKTYIELVDSDKRKFKNTPLRATIFEQTDPKDNSSMFQIFERLNTGGMPLSQQEIRNSLYHGKIIDFLNKLNSNETWRKLLNKAKPDARMRDIEMILRFFALFKFWKNYKPPMKDFINQFMENNKNLDEQKMIFFERIFSETMKIIYTEIGNNAFKIKAGLNVAVFDAITVGIAEVGLKRTRNLKLECDSLKKIEAFQNAVSQSTTNRDQLESRIKLAIQKFSQ